MSNLLSQFLNLDLFAAGEKFEPSDQCLFIGDDIPAQSEVLLKEANPLNMVMIFLQLIDRGHTPVVVPSDWTDFQTRRLLVRRPKAVTFIDRVLNVPRDVEKVTQTGRFGCLTSGSTNEPKIFYFSVEKVLANALAHAESLKIKGDDVIIQSLPVYHSFGLLAFVWTPLAVQCAVDFYVDGLHWKAFHKSRFQNGVLHISPAQMRLLNLLNLRVENGVTKVSVGGGSAFQSELQNLKNVFPEADFFVTYGLTEAGPRVSTLKWQNESPNQSLGFPIDQVELSILNQEGIKKIGTGQLIVKSPFLAIGNDVRASVAQDQILTFDLVTICENGEILFHGRQDDVINSGGVKIYPGDIEQLVNKIESVSDSALMKAKDNIYGESPVLFVESLASSEAIFDFLKEKLPANLMPKDIITIDKFPRTSIEKVNRKELLKAYLND